MRFAPTISLALLLACPAWGAPRQAGKPEIWTEIRTPHFIVTSNDGEGTARRVADQFEQIRALFSTALPFGVRMDPGIPIVIFAVKNEKGLAQLLPEYWARADGAHPAGVFVAGPEKRYIALRADGSGEAPYQTIYHEYMHMIVDLNYRQLPVWLNEGFAEFFSNASVIGKGGKLGQPSVANLAILGGNQLLPLDVLFKVDHESPHYSAANKVSVFYAESWALVHYLMLDPERQKQRALSQYISLSEAGADPLEAARQAFGDLALLQKQLESYARLRSYAEYVVSAFPRPDSGRYLARIVPQEEALSRLGDFDLHRGQFDAAQQKLVEAMRIAPNSAAPQESMGYLRLRQQNSEEAEKYFARATELDSASPFAYFYHASYLMGPDADAGELREARTALEKATALNPEFAGAWTNLGILYSRDPDLLDKAAEAARRATQLVPGEPRFQYNYGAVLTLDGKYEEARKIAERLRLAGDRQTVALGERLLRQIGDAQRPTSLRRRGAN